MNTEVMQRWQTAVVLGARGLYGQAEREVAPLIEDDAPAVRALAAALRGSHCRQLGDHRTAREYDDAGLADYENSGIDADWPYLDLLIGRAADAIGHADLNDARYWLDTAEAVAEHGSMRTLVRYGWVSAELALAHDDPQLAARTLGALEHPLAELRSPRHGVKTRMLMAVALQGVGDDASARDLLDSVLEEAMGQMWNSLMWPSAMVRARLSDDPAEQQAYLVVARNLVELIGSDLDTARAEAFVASLPPEIRPGATSS